MIRVPRAPAPADFEARVAGPGRRALQELLGDPAAPTRRGPKRKRTYGSINDIPPSELEKTHYWTRALPDMKRAYGYTCAYLAMKIHPATGAATIDHFIPKERDPGRAYDWDNFRLSTGLINAYKDTHQDVLDPFEVEDGWFTLNLLSFKVLPNSQLDTTMRERVRVTIDERLRLNEPTFCEARRVYHDRYHGLGDSLEPWPLSWLETECPFVARELRRQGRLRPEDT